MMHDFYHLDGMKQSLLGFDLVQAAALVIDCEHGYLWPNLVVHYNVHPFFFDQPFRLRPETLDVST